MDRARVPSKQAPLDDGVSAPFRAAVPGRRPSQVQTDMVATADVARRIDADLQILLAEAEYLPQIDADVSAGHTAGIDMDVFSMEWRNLMAILESLDGEFRAGMMSAEQAGRYRTLRRELRAARPIMRRLGLEVPGVELSAD